MTVGFGRSAVHEEETLHVQYVDVANTSQLDAQTVAQYLLCFTSAQLDVPEILYTKEPEIIIDAEGRELVPRLFTIEAAKNRLNSVTRPIYKDVDMSKNVVELQYDKDGPQFRELSRYEVSTKLTWSQNTMTKLRLTHAVASALRCPTGYQYLVLGSDETGAQRLALTSELTSVLCIPLESTVLCDLAGLSEASYLGLISTELIAMAIIDPLFPGQKLAIHNAPESIIRVIASHARYKGIAITFTADSRRVVVSADVTSQIQLPLYPSRSDVVSILPSDLACFVSFSTSSEAENEAIIISCIPSYFRKENMGTLFSSHSVDTGAPKAMAQQVLSRAVSLSKGRKAPNPLHQVSLETLARGESPADALSIIDWKTLSTKLPARITRFEITQLFKADKTYWLVGLSGALGISLCDWMIERGVRYLVLTSRNPKIDGRWIQNHEENGVTIKILLWYVKFF